MARLGSSLLDKFNGLKSTVSLQGNRVDQIALLGGLTKKEMARILGITERNLCNQHQGDLSVPLSVVGAEPTEGCWNPPGQGTLYTASSPELALLETLPGCRCGSLS